MLVRSLKEFSFTQIGGGEGTKDGEWLQVSQFPTSVHVELLNLKRIPDPFIGLQEWDVQWIGESRWSFKTTFSVTEDELKSSNADLLFEGLDTFATVLLNGTQILQSENQFIEYRVAVKQNLKAGENELVLNFDSAFFKGRELEKQHGKLNLWNGDSSRLHVRKAQYNYGWDWGPVLMTVGPWKPISIQFYENRIAEVDIRSQVSEQLDVQVPVALAFSEKVPGLVTVSLKAPDGTVVASSKDIKTDQGQAKAKFDFKPGQIELWYPVGYGKQPLYTVEIELNDQDGKALDLKVQKIAFRRAQVVQEKLVDQEGLSFLFEINNVRIFCGGSNWIPADSFLTTITPERYRAWLQLLIDGNQNMVRVWGGGIYEADAFYDTCDGKCTEF
ncbi:hypothetical protein VKT23_002122 [Stygiomarasmius scandens]|uniref:beta-mannosidase n=1 Tax=Marasmiellus scandens TaxID=2682957 RepID=A0ABR1K115_9AGAR